MHINDQLKCGKKSIVYSAQGRIQIVSVINIQCRNMLSLVKFCLVLRGGLTPHSLPKPARLRIVELWIIVFMYKSPGQFCLEKYVCNALNDCGFWPCVFLGCWGTVRNSHKKSTTKKAINQPKKPFPKIPLQKSPVGFVQNQSLVNYLLYFKKKVNHKG